MKKTIILSISGAAIFSFPYILQEQSAAFKNSDLGFGYSLIFMVIFFAVFIGCAFSVIAIVVSIIKKQKTGKLYISLIVIFITFFFNMLLAVFLKPDLPAGSDLQSFNSKAWKSEQATFPDENGISPRQKMLKDLVTNVLPGKTRADINELLGPSLKIEYFKSEKNDFVYSMGIERDAYLKVDSEWLLIFLNEKGTYRSFRLAND